MSLMSCQRCNKQFNPSSNNDKSCTFHRSRYVERESFTQSWDCCGTSYHGARECGIGRHITYSESWTKDDDFYAVRRPAIYINIEATRTCQRCNKQYDVNSNTYRSCTFHRCTFSGKIWDCCAAKGLDAKTCAMGKHITYDKKWIKWDDFFVKPSSKQSNIGQTGSWIYHPIKGYICVNWDEYDNLYENKEKEVKEVINMDCITEICEKYNNKKLSEAIYELMKKLPFTKVTNQLIAQMMIIDLMKTNKLYGVNLIYDLDESTNKNTDQITENLIASFSSNTLDKLAEIM